MVEYLIRPLGPSLTPCPPLLPPQGVGIQAVVVEYLIRPSAPL